MGTIFKIHNPSEMTRCLSAVFIQMLPIPILIPDFYDKMCYKATLKFSYKFQEMIRMGEYKNKT